MLYPNMYYVIYYFTCCMLYYVIFTLTALFTIRIWGSFASFLRRRYGGKGPGCTKKTCRHQTVFCSGTCCHFEASLEHLEHLQSQEESEKKEGEKKGGYTLQPQGHNFKGPCAGVPLTVYPWYLYVRIYCVLHGDYHLYYIGLI